jgi:hypothetical protein
VKRLTNDQLARLYVYYLAVTISTNGHADAVLEALEHIVFVALTRLTPEQWYSQTRNTTREGRGLR